ncbi:unnamed protein product [Effrenium voratum]|uniref:PA domain-containing protein n=1 Tax=Effrenium voratum TaxID=2562239 RepID=A0AA36HSZ9_9DINO|nr:unnamed protein product [Effrenium voratum]
MRARRWHALLLAVCARAQLQVVAPKALARQFEATHGMVYGTTATFGTPDYSQRVLGQLLWAESKGKDYCEPGDYSLPDSRPPKGSEVAKEMLKKVLLVRRGRCTFVTKVRIAEEKGAHAVVVVDKETSTKTSEDIQRTVMADDGWGDSVKIPSILLSKFDGQKLIDAARQGTVMVELAWDIPRGKVVMMEFWLSSGSREARRFLERFKTCALSLGHHLQFAPHYDIFSLDEGEDDSLCVASGSERFCAKSPEDGEVSGEEVVNEDVRQLCIWNTTSRREREDGASYSSLYWQYVADFNQRCGMQARDVARRFGEKCSLAVMGDLGIDASRVQGCVEKYRLPLLREQLQSRASHLGLQLNGWRYSGPLDPESVLKAVCGGFTTPPAECLEMQEDLHVAGGVPFPDLMAGLALLASVLIAVFFFYKRHVTSSVRRVLREEVMLEVQSQMADYVVMEDGDNRPPNQRVLSF